MKKLWRQVLAAMCAAVLLLGLLPMGALAVDGEHTVWIVGDSTACDYAATEDATYFYKRCGFGTALKEYVDATYSVQNLAASGRSSKSFPNESSTQYAALTSGIKAGDVLIIAFGHNDEKTDEAHYTAPGGTSTTEGSFAKSLTDLYIKVAQDAGATPILCTPIVRRTESASWSGDKLHQANGGDYAEDIRKLGTELNIPVVDMTALTKAKYDEVGVDESKNFHAWLASKKVDNTHLNNYGAHVVAQILAEEIAKLTDLDIASHIDAAKVTATLDRTALMVQNPGWVDPATIPYDPPTTQSAQCEPYVAGNATFYGTAMGDLAGNASAANHVRETTQSGDMHIAVMNSKGKISGTADGIVMYYYAVPDGKPFTLTAKATVNEIISGTNPNQGGFGLMARDDMYIDKGKDDLATLSSDYVTAGCLGDGSGVNFYRAGGTLNKNSSLTLAKALEAGKSYEVSIVRSVDGNYACSIDGVSKTYDQSIDNIDTAYTYVGMFCARNMDVTYSDIVLIVDGETLCDTTADDGGETPDNPDNPPKPDDPKPTVPVVVEGAVAGGGLETIFAQIADVTDAEVTAVKWSGEATGELTGDDLKYLVRDVDGGVRVDIPGVKAGTYTLTVTAKDVDYTAEGIEVQAHDRSGFAHQTVDENSACTRYTEGVGAYNDDGTLKDNAQVIYVTDANKNTVTGEFTRFGEKKTITGIGNILNSNNSKVNLGFLEFSSKEDHQPLVFRFIGTVNAPEGVSEYKKGSSNGGMVYMLSGANITLEGIGPDATIQGWGFSFGADKDDTDYNKRARNFEVRNLSFKEVPEDCVEITGFGNADGSIKESVEHVWVHNCSFYRPSDIANPAESDKAQGDGALDFKWGRYMTSSYNYFDSCHKTSLIGGSDTNEQYHVTWHHNWWKDCEQRMPLARAADVHLYNNLCELDKANTSSGTWYGMSLRANSYAYSEYNTFLKVKNPVKLEATSGSTVPVGACKSYQNVFTDCTGTNDATIVTDKTQTVTSANKYANFDTAAGSYVAAGKYLLDTDDRGLANIEAWGGVLKTADKMTTVTMTIPGAEDPGDEPGDDPSDDPSDEPVAVTGVTLDKTTAKVDEDETVTITATVTPDGATDKSVNWSSSDETLATVDANGKVTGKKAGEVTITATTNDGGLTATCVVTVIAANPGSIKRPSPAYTIPPVTTKPDETKPDDTTPAADVAETYGDVEADSWYTSGVQFVVDKKIFVGVSDHSFAPAMSMSRAMVMTVLARVDGKEPTAKAGEPWYSEAMAWAVTAGVSDGTNPEVDVTLEQFATMLYRYAVDKKLADAVEVDLTGVPDADQVSDWAAQAITWAKAQGILQGDQAGKLNPQNNASRAQAAVIMERFVEKCVK